MKTDLHISPLGDDNNSGFLPEPSPSGEDGPLRTLSYARIVARQLVRSGQSRAPVTIWAHGGRYPLRTPVRFGPEDSGMFELRAWQQEKPVFDGGVRLSEWKEVEFEGRRVWAADVSRILLEHGPFRSLFRGQQRLARARYPVEGFLWSDAEAADKADLTGNHNVDLLRGNLRFRARPGDLEGIRGLENAEVLMLNRWVMERLPVRGFDPDTRIIEMRNRTLLFLRCEFEDPDKTMRYWFENVSAGLSAPGCWFLDEAGRTLYYAPKDGEKMENFEAIVPVVDQFLRFEGDAGTVRTVRGLRLEGIGFEYADWKLPCNRHVWWDPGKDESEWRPRASYRSMQEINGANPRNDCGTAPQAAFNVPGVLHFEGAEDCIVEGCRISHVGYHGVSLWQGCRGNRIEHCEISDMGAGGVIMDGTDVFDHPSLKNERNVVTGNRISCGGHVFPAGCGVTLVHASQTVVTHNEIFDMTYSGISCGWVWGIFDNPSQLNRIEFNHIHHIGTRGNLSDMGGIYVLGPQPGTVLRGNYIHDVSMASYGGWGIYLDEGASQILIESNIICRTASEAFHEHMGRQNVYVNNLVVHPRGGAFRFTRNTRNCWAQSPPFGGIISGNVFITKGTPFFDDYRFFTGALPMRHDANIYWNEDGEPFSRIRHARREGGQVVEFRPEDIIGLDAWRDLSAGDMNSISENPGLVWDGKGNPLLGNTSLLRRILFHPVRPGNAGVR